MTAHCRPFFEAHFGTLQRKKGHHRLPKNPQRSRSPRALPGTNPPTVFFFEPPPWWTHPPIKNQPKKNFFRPAIGEAKLTPPPPPLIRLRGFSLSPGSHLEKRPPGRGGGHGAGGAAGRRRRAHADGGHRGDRAQGRAGLCGWTESGWALPARQMSRQKGGGARPPRTDGIDGKRWQERPGLGAGSAPQPEAVGRKIKRRWVRPE